MAADAESVLPSADQISDRLFTRTSLRCITAASHRERDRLKRLFTGIESARKSKYTELDHHMKIFRKKAEELDQAKREARGYYHPHRGRNTQSAPECRTKRENSILVIPGVCLVSGDQDSSPVQTLKHLAKHTRVAFHLQRAHTAADTGNPHGGGQLTVPLDQSVGSSGLEVSCSGRWSRITRESATKDTPTSPLPSTKSPRQSVSSPTPSMKTTPRQSVSSPTNSMKDGKEPEPAKPAAKPVKKKKGGRSSKPGISITIPPEPETPTRTFSFLFGGPDDKLSDMERVAVTPILFPPLYCATLGTPPIKREWNIFERTKRRRKPLTQEQWEGLKSCRYLRDPKTLTSGRQH